MWPFQVMLAFTFLFVVVLRVTYEVYRTWLPFHGQMFYSPFPTYLRLPPIWIRNWSSTDRRLEILRADCPSTSHLQTRATNPKEWAETAKFF